MHREYSAQEVRVVAAARAMLLAGGLIPTRRLAAVSWCSVRQLEMDFDRVLGASICGFAASIQSNQHTALLNDAPGIAQAVFAAGFVHTGGYFGSTAPLPGTGASGPWRERTDVGFGWTVLSTAIGEVVAVASDHGLVSVKVLPDTGPDLPGLMAADFPGIQLRRAEDELAHVRAVLTALAAGRAHHNTLPTDVPHTAFQARVWASLRRIPARATRSYAQVAIDLGAPKAVRAVGRACATNPVALVVPCHRVVASNGQLGGYRWGVPVKAQLLELERNCKPAESAENRAWASDR